MKIAMAGSALVALLAVPAPSTAQEPADGAGPVANVRPTTFVISGTSVHYFTTGIVHAVDSTAAGKVQRSTEMIRLSGDLEGYVLYHPTSVFDYAEGTLTNTGKQVFSGTVAGSAPVVLHDDTFRFVVDLATGRTTGRVHLRRSADAPRDAPWYECDLTVTGAGFTPAGDIRADYAGTCTARDGAG